MLIQYYNYKCNCTRPEGTATLIIAGGSLVINQTLPSIPSKDVEA